MPYYAWIDPFYPRCVQWGKKSILGIFQFSLPTLRPGLIYSSLNKFWGKGLYNSQPRKRQTSPKPLKGISSLFALSSFILLSPNGTNIMNYIKKTALTLAYCLSLANRRPGRRLIRGKGQRLRSVSGRLACGCTVATFLYWRPGFHFGTCFILLTMFITCSHLCLSSSGLVNKHICWWLWWFILNLPKFVLTVPSLSDLIMFLGGPCYFLLLIFASHNSSRPSRSEGWSEIIWGMI